MTVTIDDNAGFCFGVVRAIDTAERQLAQSGTLYCLGDIVHNNAEVQRLKHQGLRVIAHADLATLGGRKVLIRAHGEPPGTYQQAAALGIDLVDATCPIVLALQERIRKGYEEMRASVPQGQVVIFGKPGHAEVIGLCGQTEGAAIVVSHPDDLDAIDFHHPIRLYSQTTKSREEYRQLIAHIRQGTEACGMTDFVAYDTVCNRVANRAAQLERFARSVDGVLFVAGEGSSNGQYLYEYCKSVQPHTWLVTDVDAFDPAVCGAVQTVGITGATSTPRWLMEKAASKFQGQIG